jgi:hypothetical protein
MRQRGTTRGMITVLKALVVDPQFYRAPDTNHFTIPISPFIYMHSLSFGDSSVDAIEDLQKVRLDVISGG